MSCPRCGSRELIFLFKQDRLTKEGKYLYTWQYSECSDCELIITERVPNLGDNAPCSK